MALLVNNGTSHRAAFGLAKVPIVTRNSARLGILDALHHKPWRRSFETAEKEQQLCYEAGRLCDATILAAGYDGALLTWARVDYVPADLDRARSHAYATIGYSAPQQRQLSRFLPMGKLPPSGRRGVPAQVPTVCDQ